MSLTIREVLNMRATLKTSTIVKEKLKRNWKNDRKVYKFFS